LVANVLIEPSQKSSRDGALIARDLVRDIMREPVRIINVISHENVLRDGITIGHGDPGAWAATFDYKKPEARRKRGFC
jgi:hypothetical protein